MKLRKLRKPKSIKSVRHMLRGRIRYYDNRIKEQYAKIEEYGKHNLGPDLLKSVREIHSSSIRAMKQVSTELRVLLARLDGEYTDMELMMAQSTSKKYLRAMWKEISDHGAETEN